ncbi:MAG: histidine ammonia-lyase [Gemmatimonadota bacterium]|nr:histidine ammonia-lyase [Gemmatimonadota bacterium]MDQ8146730.1 histidine ammonia-lyase [Gemmatimonadota bacterium]MDQ8149147.1 histidine ammonia-lyase [Gemmatimonadota bacterium]MDQ8156827.1 histidine ammonia-lyase [Gemmatimonadota bacterium]MDQ8176083.1 histidine ammonia-lyase [Gemmatimonadota bacterium]
MTLADALYLDGASLTVADLLAVAEGERPVTLAAAARARMQSTRDVVEGIAARGEVVYGVTTGFGKLSDIAIPGDQLAQLQVNLVRSHAVGVGPRLARPEVRAMMLLRANVLAKGFSGARPALAELLCGMLNADCWPDVPEQGSVGASGDLAPLAHLALALLGEGELNHAAGRGPAAEVLRAHGLAPVTLGPKEGLALINGTQAHTAVAALALVQAHRCWDAAHAAGAMTLEALLGTPVAFDARIHDARGQAGQRESAARLRALLADSEIRESHREDDPRVQDAYALRCMPQVHGPVREAIRFAEGLIAAELNAATDNPLVFDDGTMLSGGNFHGQAVAMALDVLGIAMTNLAVMSERRIDRLVNPAENEGLPPFLTSTAGVSSGFMMAQVTAAAITSECKGLAHPASVDSIPTDGSKEDVVPMAMGAAIKLRRILHNVRHVLGVELMCGAQGIEYRRPLRGGGGVERAYAAVRSRVSTLAEDRVLGPDIEALAAAVGAGAFA